jgi:hypothetical protein
MTCKNCQAVIQGAFCAACGQKAEIHRITVSLILHDLVHAFTHADKGILLLTRELFLRPGIVAREYIEGKRKKYFNPLSFLVLTTALSAYLIYQTGYFEGMSARRSPGTEQVQRKGYIDPNVKKEVARINTEDNKMIGLVLIAPLIAFLSWMLFKGSGYTYAENFVLAAFLFGLANILRIFIFIPLHVGLPGKTPMIDGVFQLVFLVYIVISFRQFFKNKLLLTIVKSVVFLLLFITLFWVCMYSYAYVKVNVKELFA